MHKQYKLQSGRLEEPLQKPRSKMDWRTPEGREDNKQLMADDHLNMVLEAFFKGKVDKKHPLIEIFESGWFGEAFYAER